MTGGTGLYIKALLYDYEFAKTAINVDENKYKDFTNEQLHKKLIEVDRKSAKEIHLIIEKELLELWLWLKVELKNLIRKKNRQASWFMMLK